MRGITNGNDWHVGDSRRRRHKVRYLSVCSGIEAATVAWHPLGWEPVAFSEVDAFPSAVLKHHYPHVPNWGDMTKFQEWPDAAIDVLVGGTPCQSFSVAGLRKGLADPRGNLALVYLAILDRYRPTWCCWENVPGVLSSDDGRAFGSFLGGLGKLGYGFAYRVLDAQHFNLAQRRARVFVVGCLGDWRRAAAVLFERESLSGHPAPRREAGQDVAGELAKSLRGHSNASHREDSDTYVPAISPALKSRDYKGPSSDGDGDGDGSPLIAHSLRAEGFDASEDGTGRGTPLVVAAEGDIASPQRCGGNDHADYQNIVGVAHAFDARQSDVIQYGDQAGPLDTDGHSIAVGFYKNQGSHGGGIDVELAPTLKGSDDGHQSNLVGVAQHMAVRRLTPIECCRLMGFPDDYLDILYRGKPAADGPKYKALGNSMAVPCMSWIGKRIHMVEEIAEDVA